MRAQSWKRVAWSQHDTRGGKAVLTSLKDMRLEPRVTGPQHITDVRQFLDKNIGYAALDDKTKVAGLPWRSRMLRVRPSTDMHPGKRGFDPREVHTDIPTPDGTQQLLALGESRHIALYDTGAAGQEEKLVGTVVYSVVPQEEGAPLGVLRAVATAPSHRRRTAASLLILGAMEDMRLGSCEACYGQIPNEDVRAKPWLLGWLESLGFAADETARDGVTVVNNVVAEESTVLSRFEADDEPVGDVE
eukprot:TRINITY_DN16729_c0_g1_i1.p1 TRINITY_DN16729_c0_g1~~TRINITY_DN16729_c0_g1_i1.p1  ORF type:complete len:246 (+),score=55.47 TRINITY_DN16729_c0_g1_i1:43-780(+)